MEEEVEEEEKYRGTGGKEVGMFTATTKHYLYTCTLGSESHCTGMMSLYHYLRFTSLAVL